MLTLLAAALSLAAALWVSPPRAARCDSARARARCQAIFAGSLVDIMEHDLGPAFRRRPATPSEGYGGGSSEDRRGDQGRVRQGDVFVSAAAAADTELEGRPTASWVSWYSTFAAIATGARL